MKILKPYYNYLNRVKKAAIIFMKIFNIYKFTNFLDGMTRES